MNSNRSGARRAAWPACILVGTLVVSAAAPLSASTSQVLIQRANLDGTSAELVLEGGSGTPGGIDLDLDAGKVYWTVEDCPGKSRVRRANLDGSGAEDLVSGLDRALDVAVDTTRGKIYWNSGSTCSFGPDYLSKISRADLDGSNVEDVLTGGAIAMGLALDTAAGKLYWTTDVDCVPCGGIARANLDGSDVETLVFPLEGPQMIDLDVDGGQMYWADRVRLLANGAVLRAGLDGSQLTQLVVEPDPPWGIALDATHVYWTSRFAGKIRRARLDGTGIQDLLLTDGPTGIAVDRGNGKFYWVALGTGIPVPATSVTGLLALLLLVAAIATVLLLGRSRQDAQRSRT